MIISSIGSVYMYMYMCNVPSIFVVVCAWGHCYGEQGNKRSLLVVLLALWFQVVCMRTIIFTFGHTSKLKIK